jgi:uncharacterized membrane protein
MIVYRRPVTVLLVAACLLTIGAFVPLTFVRALMVLVPAFVLPGASLLFGLGALRGRWDPLPTFALCVITSLAFYPLAGLLIYAGGIRLSRVSAVLDVDIFVLLMLTLESVKANRGKHVAPLLVEPLLVAHQEGGTDGHHWGVWLALVASICAAVLVLGLVLLPEGTPAPYTQFYFTGSTAKLDGTITVLPRALLVTPIAVRIHSGATGDYIVSAKLDGSTFAPRLYISVPKSGTWTGAISGAVNGPGCLHQLVINLLNRSGTSTLASLDLWIQVRKSGCST